MSISFPLPPYLLGIGKLSFADQKKEEGGGDPLEKDTLDFGSFAVGGGGGSTSSSAWPILIALSGHLSCGEGKVRAKKGGWPSLNTSACFLFPIQSFEKKNPLEIVS